MEGAVAQLQSAWQKYDDFVVKAICDRLEKAGWVDYENNPRPSSHEYSVVRSPSALIVWMALYGLVVAVGYLRQYGKAKPTEKKPDGILLKSFIILHNIFLIVLSAYMFGGTWYWFQKYNYPLWGRGLRQGEEKMAQMVVLFYVSKWYEFFDTYIMLAKGNLQQVNFLHVYHHFSIAAIWWLVSYIAPGGDVYFEVQLNSLVHVIMYTYYLMALLVGKDPVKKKKYLWWGRYLTMFQMTQFVTMFAHATYCYLYSPISKHLSATLIVYMVTLLYLFYSFFQRKHGQKVKSV